jgi:hypothetical protein
MDDAAILSELGRMAVGGAALELRASLIAAAALGLPQRTGMYLLGRETTSRTFDHAAEALRAAPASDARDLALRWIADSRTAYQNRNRLLHSVAARTADGELYQIRISSSLTGPAFEEHPVDIEEVRAAAHELDALSGDFDEAITAALIRDLPYTRPALGHPPS